MKPGDNTLPLMYSTPSGVTLDDMVPNQVNVHIEARTTKSFSRLVEYYRRAGSRL
ncbi:hypothetical protein ACFSQ7_06860 [Paenibacillus rhizoplanae]